MFEPTSMGTPSLGNNMNDCSLFYYAMDYFAKMSYYKYIDVGWLGLLPESGRPKIKRHPSASTKTEDGSRLFSGKDA